MHTLSKRTSRFKAARHVKPRGHMMCKETIHEATLAHLTTSGDPPIDEKTWHLMLINLFNRRQALTFSFRHKKSTVWLCNNHLMISSMKISNSNSCKLVNHLSQKRSKIVTLLLKTLWKVPISRSKSSLCSKKWFAHLLMIHKKANRLFKTSKLILEDSRKRIWVSKLN